MGNIPSWKEVQASETYGGASAEDREKISRNWFKKARAETKGRLGLLFDSATFQRVAQEAGVFTTEAQRQEAEKGIIQKGKEALLPSVFDEEQREMSRAEGVQFATDIGIDPELIEQWRSMPEMGAKEAVTGLSGTEKIKKIPVIGTSVGGAESLALVNAFKRLASTETGDPRDNVYLREQVKHTADIQAGGEGLLGHHKEDDEEMMAEYLIRIAEPMVRGSTISHGVTKGITDLPKYMGEFYLTGGASKLVTAPVRALVQKKIKSRVAATAASFAARTVVQSSLLAPTAATDYAERRLAGEEPGKALAKTAAGHVIETGSEILGEFLPAGKAGTFVDRLRKSRRLTKPRKVLKSLGVSDWPAEMFEEAVATASRGLTGVDNYTGKEDPTYAERVIATGKEMTDPRNLITQAGVIGFPALGGRVAESLTSSKGLQEKFKQTVELAVEEKVKQGVPEEQAKEEVQQEVQREIEQAITEQQTQAEPAKPVSALQALFGRRKEVEEGAKTFEALKPEDVKPEAIIDTLADLNPDETQKLFDALGLPERGHLDLDKPSMDNLIVKEIIETAPEEAPVEQPIEEPVTEEAIEPETVPTEETIEEPTAVPEATPEAVAEEVIPEAAEPAPPPELPKDLAGAKPRYNFGPKSFTPEFESDIDKALYITSQKSKSKRDADYRAWLIEQGVPANQIDALGTQVRSAIKEQAKAIQSGEPLVVPMQFAMEPQAPVDVVPAEQQVEPIEGQEVPTETPGAAFRERLGIRKRLAINKARDFAAPEGVDRELRKRLRAERVEEIEEQPEVQFTGRPTTAQTEKMPASQLRRTAVALVEKNGRQTERQRLMDNRGPQNALDAEIYKETMKEYQSIPPGGWTAEQEDMKATLTFYYDQRRESLGRELAMGKESAEDKANREAEEKIFGMSKAHQTKLDDAKKRGDTKKAKKILDQHIERRKALEEGAREMLGLRPDQNIEVAQIPDDIANDLALHHKYLGAGSMREALLGTRIVHLLSNFKTGIINIKGSATFALHSLLLRRSLEAALNTYGAPLIGKKPDPAAPIPSELKFLVDAAIKAQIPSILNAVKAGLTGRSTYNEVHDSTGKLMQKNGGEVEYLVGRLKIPRAIAKRIKWIGDDGRLIGFETAKKLGWLDRFRANINILAADEYVKNVVHNIEAAMVGHRLAVAHGLKKGTAAYDNAIANAIQDKDSVVNLRAKHTAERVTFQKELGTVGKLPKLARKLPHALGIGAEHIALFTNAPANLIKERVGLSPLGLLKVPFAMLSPSDVPAFRGEGKFAFKTRQGGELIEDLADNVITLGAMLGLWTMMSMRPKDEDDDDEIPWLTGSPEGLPGSGARNLQNKVAPPMSINIHRYAKSRGWDDVASQFPDKFFSYAKIDPFAGVASSMVDTLNAMEDMERGQPGTTAMLELWKKQIASLEKASYVPAVHDMYMGLSDPEKLVDVSARFLSSWVPADFRAYQRAKEDIIPNYRQTGQGWAERIGYQTLQRSGLLDVTHHRDVFGNILKKDQGESRTRDMLWNWLSPMDVINTQDGPAMQREFFRMWYRWNKRHPVMPQQGTRISKESEMPWYPTPGDDRYTTTLKEGGLEVRATSTMTNEEKDLFMKVRGETFYKAMLALNRQRKFNFLDPTFADIKRSQRAHREAGQAANKAVVAKFRKKTKVEELMKRSKR